MIMQKIKLWKKTLFNTLVSKDPSVEAEIFSTTGLINNSSYDTDNQNSRKKDWSGNKTTDYDRKTDYQCHPQQEETKWSLKIIHKTNTSDDVCITFY